MATATYAAVPAFAAALGIYLSRRSHYRIQNFKGVAPTSITDMLVKGNKDVDNLFLPNLAPEFDGLHCFETLVSN